MIYFFVFIDANNEFGQLFEFEFIPVVGGGERGQLRQANRKKMAPSAISVPHGEPGPLMLSASAISAFSVTGDSTILESKLKRR